MDNWRAESIPALKTAAIVTARNMFLITFLPIVHSFHNPGLLLWLFSGGHNAGRARSTERGEWRRK
jgi:hypothetical protein